MKNITLSAHAVLIERGRKLAAQRQTTLNQMFRDWLEGLSGKPLQSQDYREMMTRLGKNTKVGGRKFSREEMNER